MKWQHVFCAGFESAKSVPNVYVCLLCRLGQDQSVKTMRLAGNVALLRRTVMVSWQEGYKSNRTMANRLCCDKSKLRTIRNQMIEHGFIIPSKAKSSNADQNIVIKNQKTRWLRKSLMSEKGLHSILKGVNIMPLDKGQVRLFNIFRVIPMMHR